jgi:hypothetical protein
MSQSRPNSGRENLKRRERKNFVLSCTCSKKACVVGREKEGKKKTVFTPPGLAKILLN